MAARAWACRSGLAVTTWVNSRPWVAWISGAWNDAPPSPKPINPTRNPTAAIAADYALSGRLQSLEVNDHVRGEFHRGGLVWHDAGIGISVESRRAERPPIADFGAEFDLRRKPMLQTQCVFHIFDRLADAGAPAIRIVIKLRAEGEIVEPVERVVDVGQGAKGIRRAIQLGGIVAIDHAGSIEVHELRRERACRHC